MFCFKKEGIPFYFALTFSVIILASCIAKAQTKTLLDTTTRKGIFIADSLFNFGKIKPLRKLNHTFYFVNNTNDTITIDKIMPSCECTVARCQNKTVLPFSKTAIIATVDLTGVTGEKFVAVEIYLKGSDAIYECYLQGEIIDMKK